ncbi:hypothetical protein ACOBR2_00125 [Telmatobacter bradus]|uniref:hypothetical protein n=1 Tax=Telmatobacter bradus TaxID=474953 RepID=UPI003B43D22A
MRGMICRVLRLETVAGLGIALAMSVLPAVARAESVSTETTLNVTTHVSGGQTVAKAEISVAGNDGSAASGVVGIYEGKKLLATAALSDSGATVSEFTVTGGAHALSASYLGDTTHTASTSATSNVAADSSSTTPGFTLALSATSLSLTAGKAGTIVATVIPTNNSSLSAPMFVTVSCSGLPDQSTCTFSPSSVELTSATATTACSTSSSSTTCPPTSTMTLQTEAAGTAKLAVPSKHPSSLVLALLIPGALGFGGLAWSARRKLYLSRMALIALLAVVASLGLSGCNPRYDYYNHAPTTNEATPAGSYTVTITGQSTYNLNTKTAFTTIALTVS